MEDRAQLVAAKYASAGTWDINPAPLPRLTPPITTKPMADGRDEVNSAIDGFLAELAGDGSAQGTLKKYGLVLGKLRSYAADQGYTRLDAFTNLVVRDVRTG